MARVHKGAANSCGITNRRTQPWLTGLPYRGDFAARSSPLQRLKNILHLTEFHQPHPHEAFFLQLLRECLENGQVTEDAIHEEIRRGRLRRDALRAVNAYTERRHHLD